ncbi:ABC transporter substrate-binding protein [Siccirubricoccus sp. KC 17139]|uniref:ABC transporter substrate-binding protein n=1 Tax=Siccirubricoccus soli TaxID=2899147 RepID=A0ABT1CZJ8_9PROT|nr:ABC transporter substrate-binding protein [Siccirubricoccus soli]MCO6415089.1 ABC transporter substrate-binding protein [Siccirubricoccus soli]MCP2681220.1 ABC transporter substrate-binding protein [Siccirubricoccus soli]
MKRHGSPGTAFGRRQFLEAAAALGTLGLLPGQAGSAELPLEFDGSRFQLAAPEPNPKRGGVLRYAITSRPPHFDVHQSGTINSLGAQGCMFDNLIRRDPRDSGKTIIPDLAHSWQIAPDGKTYTFHLREGVQFHDGAELTAEDVKATYDRIVRPPAGVSIPRSTLFAAVSEINARDKRTIEFKLAEARPPNFIMSAFASGWNVIFRKKTLEDNGYNLRRVVNIPGTGPFRSVRRVENEVWVMERNANYWNKGLPYLDGLEFYHALPFSPELGSALLSGRVDYARIMDPVSNRRARATPGMSGADFYQSVIQATWVNAKKKPLDDPRVRRALHLVLDKNVLVEVVKDVAPMMVGGFIYPFSDFATPRAELVKRIGYQTDTTAAVREAKALMAAAGQGRGIRGLDLIVRDVASFKLWAQAIQAMLQQALSVECRLRSVVESVWFDDVRSGNYDLAIGAVVSTLLDPSDYFNAWYKEGGSQNYSNWSDPKLEPLLPQIDSEVDSEKRLGLIRQAEAIMEQNPPLLPVAWEKIMDGWYNYVKGHVPYEYFGIYDVVRMDTMWLDK